MSLSYGREFLAIPGPSVMPDRVLNAMHRGAPSIYDGALVDMVEGMTPDLQAVARTTSARPVIYIANGHGAWEATAANLFSRGDKALAMDNGRFAAGWAGMAQTMGVDVEIMDEGLRGPVSPQRLEDRLRADKNHEIKAVMVVQVDTASSAANDIPALRAAIDAAGHPALFMVDCVACLGSMPFEMDAWGVDVMVGGSQKGLMTPPGLGFVWVGDRAWAASGKGDLNTSYWDWRPRAEPEMFYQRFCGTAPTHLLFGLREALTMLVHEEGLEAAWHRHAVLAKAVRACISVWSEAGALEFNVQDAGARSDVVTTVLTPGMTADAGPDVLRKLCETQMGVVLGMGIGQFSGRAFRIGHMGHLSAPMILGVLGAAEAGFGALGVPVRSGLEAAAKVVADAIRP
ncbi:MAG: alanine-glyoxylate transaminase/serine-glyoxylate transaminase/serine-pyruvate transaminase [Paracoccaceae bacterium]|jgi:alanine-glyoxylate transaminase/serine-glyoxylate transaminase/serine-pyruvate transaminase